MLLMASQNSNSQRFDHLEYFAFSSSLATWWSWREEEWCEGGQRRFALNWGQSRYENSNIEKSEFQKLVLRHFMVSRVTEPFCAHSLSSKAKWRNNKISAKSDRLLCVPWHKMNLRINRFTPFTRRLIRVCSCHLVALGHAELRKHGRIVCIYLRHRTCTHTNKQKQSKQKFESSL